MQDFSKIGPNSTGPPNGRPSPSSPDASDSARSSSPITTVPTTTITPGTEEKRDDATRDLDDASASTNHNSDDPRPDQNQTTYLSSARLYAIMFALLLAAIMLTLDTSILGTALPRITDEFNTIVDIGWYASAYMVASCTLQPLTGKVYTHFSLKYSFLGFMAFFELGSVLCAASTSSTMLILGRAVAGLGGSGLINGAFTIIGVAAPPDTRPVFIGIIMAFAAGGQVIGPLVGGLLTQHASWRWCFWINLPVGAVTAGFLLFTHIPNQEKKKSTGQTRWTIKSVMHEFDLIGFTLFAPASIMLLIALEWGGTEYAWNSSTIIGLLCGSVATFCVFVFWERHQSDEAMIPIGMMSQRVIYSSCLSAGLQGASLLVLSYYLPLWFQIIKHDSPTTSAVDTLPIFLCQIVAAIVSSMLVRRVGIPTPFAILGNALSAVGTGFMSTFTLSTRTGQWVGYQILTGTGRGLSIQQSTDGRWAGQPISAVQGELPPSQIATGTAIVSWSQFFGGALFITLAETTFTSCLRTALHHFAPDVDPDAIIRAGATNYESILPAGGRDRHEVLLAYNRAITQVYYLSVAASTVGAFVSFGMGWKRAKKNERREGRDHA